MKSSSKQHLIYIVLFLLLPVVAMLFGKSESQPTIKDLNAVRVTEVIDGDTLKIKQAGQEYTVRFIGIDTPETSHPSKPVQCYGQEAKEFLTEMLSNKEITLEKDISETDRYGRLLRYVYLGDVLVNEELVEKGYAYAKAFPPDIKYQELFRQAQKNAETAKEGLWSPQTCNGSRDV